LGPSRAAVGPVAGQAAEVFGGTSSTAVFHADMFLEHPTIATRYSFPAGQLMDQVARALAARSEGVLELVCRFRCTASATRWTNTRRPPRAQHRPNH